LKELLQAGESETLEFKPRLRAANARSNPDAKRDVELKLLKSIAGFLNGCGGILIVGVNDNGEPNGTLLDEFPGSDNARRRDKAQQYLTDLLVANLGALAAVRTRSQFCDIDGCTVLRIECPFNIDVFPVYVSQGQTPSTRILYVRVGNTTQQFGGEDQIRYIDLVRKEHGGTSTSEGPSTTRTPFPPMYPMYSKPLPSRKRRVATESLSDWCVATERLYPQWASYREVEVGPYSTVGFEISGRLSSASQYFRFGFKLLSRGGRSLWRRLNSVSGRT
jgi:hypothetical protein